MKHAEFGQPDAPSVLSMDESALCEPAPASSGPAGSRKDQGQPPHTKAGSFVMRSPDPRAIWKGSLEERAFETSKLESN